MQAPISLLCRMLPERLRAALRLNSELVVNGATQPLLAAEVSFGRLNRDVPEQELDLLKLSACLMTRTICQDKPEQLADQRFGRFTAKWIAKHLAPLWGVIHRLLKNQVCFLEIASETSEAKSGTVPFRISRS